MKKLLVMLMVAVLALSATAFAAKYTHDDDISFEYDENAFEISMDDHTDDEDLVILTGKNAAWGNTFIRIYLGELRDGETFPTPETLNVMPDAGEVTQGPWNGFENVLMYTVEQDDFSETYFIAPVKDDDDDDDEIEAILTVTVGVTAIEDEQAAMERDDQISAVLDTLKVSD